MSEKKKKSEKELQELWSGITEEDFLNEKYIEEVDIVDYNVPAMTLFIQNTNLFRQLTMEKDGLKPIERRMMYMLYEAGAYMTSKNDRRAFRKSSKIVGDIMGIHAHSDESIYDTLVSNGQRWKKSVPLIKPSGNFANVTSSDEYGHMRYTEALASYYAYCCFFKDIDKDCLEMIISTTGGDRKADDEPLALPTRYPNILVNGGFGLAMGNMFCIPPFQIDDIIENTIKVINNPDIPSIYMIPDFPTGCDIVDEDGSLHTMCETGKGSFKLRSTIEIDRKKNDGDWILKIKNVPWLSDFAKCKDRIYELYKSGDLQIKTVIDNSYQTKTKDGDIETQIDFWIVVDRSLDPYQFRNKLFKLTALEKPLNVDFNVVTNELRVNRPSLKDLIQMWIDSRREYKRRLYNKTLSKLNARIGILEILIHLTEKSRVTKTMKIITESSLNEAASKLMKEQKMNSFQAQQILGMGIKAFHKDAHDEYVAELKTVIEKKEEIMKIVHSNKKIDKIIIKELEELRQWAVPRRCDIVDSNYRVIADTDHLLVITNGNLIKKIGYKQEIVGKPISMGTFKTNDYPKFIIPKINNLDTVSFFDMYGNYSTIQVYDIENTASANVGIPVYDIAKLSGPVISMMRDFNEESIRRLYECCDTTLNLVSLSADGFIKKTPVESFLGHKAKNTRYSKIRENDYLVAVSLLLDTTVVIVYTAKGDFSILNTGELPEHSKNSTGLSCVNLDDMDMCIGLSAIGNEDQYLIVVTERGMVKRVEVEYLGDISPRRKKIKSYLTSLDDGDKVVWIGAANDKDKYLKVFTRTDYYEILIDDIPILSRKSKGKKMIAVPLGSGLINIEVI